MGLRLCDLIVQQAKQYFDKHPVAATSQNEFVPVGADLAIVEAIEEMFASEYFDREHRFKLRLRLAKELWPDEPFVPNVWERVSTELELRLETEIGNYKEQMRERGQLADKLEVHPDHAARVNVANP